MTLEASAADREWLAQQFDALTTSLVVQSPSEWAERNRYLPPSATPLPGFYRFEVAPYLREILDCLSVDSPVREIAVMKGVQLCITTGVLENAIGYYIDHVKCAPMMMVTADAELAKLRVETSITPMLQLSGLEHLIKSSDEKNTRKTGKTDKKVEWIGGGFLIPFGAINANKLRSIPIQVLLRDEVDGWPDRVGNDGDPIKLSGDRTAAYESSRKILDISTPLIKGTSKIAKRFERGDQRRYFVRCVKCAFSQVLRWRHEDKDTGEVTGIVWETDADGKLVTGSVRYLCTNCGHAHVNDDKTRLLAPEHGAEWRPTATPAHPHVRSYHLSALYSPVGMQSWEACVQKWLEAWDVAANRPRDVEALQVFYNNVLGEVFEIRGEKIRFETVSSHRRAEYLFGQIPNRWLEQYCGGKLGVLTCAVDVHADNLAVAVYGWCRDQRAVLVDYWRFEGDTEQLENEPWQRLQTLIESKVYEADDGTRYGITLTFVDSGYRADLVYRFCGQYESGVHPVKGRETSPGVGKVKGFAPFSTPSGVVAYGITVDLYKDRWAAALRRGWDGLGMQPEGHFNAPLDATDRQLRELTAETKVEKIDKTTGKRLGVEWRRPSGAPNELWDLLIYSAAALEVLADEVRAERDLEIVNWIEFWSECANGRYHAG